MILTENDIIAPSIEQYKTIKRAITHYSSEIEGERVVINALSNYFIDIMFTLNQIQTTHYILEQCINVIKEIKDEYK